MATKKKQSASCKPTHSLSTRPATTYPDWDNFSRTTQNDWFRVGITNSVSAFYDARISYDRNSNISKVLEPLYVMNTTSKDVFDVLYSNDNLNRLTATDQGHWTGSVISDTTNYETWSLTQTGNWASYVQDIDKNSSVNVNVSTNALPFSDEDDTRNPSSNFNGANEFIGSVTRYIGTGSGSTTQSLNYANAYDAVGNMVDDKVNYLYKYDAFGRLVEVKTLGSALVAEYRYNALGYRTGWHYDADKDSSVESGSPGDDPWYWFAYNERWQEVATFRYTDSDPKQRVIHNAAGIAGTGNSSYIDSVILTDTHSGSWTAAASGSLATRRYFLQNWRNDVVATTTDAGDPYEYVRYNAYGVPTTFPAADANRDMTTNSTDETDWLTVFSGGSAAVVIGADINKDDLYPDTADFDFMTAESALTTKRGGFNKVGTGNPGPSLRFAYAGYAWDPAIKSYHVRHRVYSAEMGRWLTRDPTGYVDGTGLMQYAQSHPITSVDPDGLCICVTRWGPVSVGTPTYTGCFFGLFGCNCGYTNSGCTQFCTGFNLITKCVFGVWVVVPVPCVTTVSAPCTPPGGSTPGSPYPPWVWPAPCCNVGSAVICPGPGGWTPMPGLPVRTWPKLPGEGAVIDFLVSNPTASCGASGEIVAE